MGPAASLSAAWSPGRATTAATAWRGRGSRNVFATYLHGPCLPKNPWLTDQLIRIAVGRAEGISPAKVALAPLNDDLERRAHDVALVKAMANRGRRTALEPAKLVRGQKRYNSWRRKVSHMMPKRAGTRAMLKRIGPRTKPESLPMTRSEAILPSEVGM